MPVMQNVTSTAAGAAANVVTGQQFERAPRNSKLRFYATADAAGESRITIFIGSRLILAESPLSRAARQPIVPDDWIIDAVAAKGDQINITHRNTGAGANNLFWRIEMRYM